MRKRRLRKRATFLIMVGTLAAMFSTGSLLSVPETLQYVAASLNCEVDLRQTITVKKKLDEQLSDCTSVVSVGIVAEKMSASAEGTSETTRVYAVGEGWFEVYPVFIVNGRRLTETELTQGDCVALLDEGLAFSLFGSELPSNARVNIGKIEYRVVGTIRHRRNVGEGMEHCVYVPLTSAEKLESNALMFVAKPIAKSGAQIMFENTIRAVWNMDGCFYNTKKEVLRQMMLPRMLLLSFGLSTILALLRCMNRVSIEKVKTYREKLRWNYFQNILPMLSKSIIICLLGYILIVSLLYALIAFSIQPLTTFTEWVPENIVEWSSLKNVFWNLTDNAAKLVKVGSREIRQIEFWGRILHWSMVVILVGVIQMRRKDER